MKNLFGLSLLILVLLPIQIIISQQENEINLSGSLLMDSKILFAENTPVTLPEIKLQQEGKKSPVLAGLFSLIIPGSGEIYAESYLKGAIFLVIEVAAITTAVIYDNKGDDQTDQFQNYADDYTNPDHNWSVIKYAKWLIEYHDADPEIILSEDPNRPPWEQVDWSLLNANEHGSHKLPHHGEQQYYELIGKYFQYSAGWNDYTSGANNSVMSPNFHFYSAMRGEANDYYNVASKAVILIYVNHFLSVLDAVWTTANYNSNLAVKIRMEQQQFANKIDLVPTLRFSYNF